MVSGNLILTAAHCVEYVTTGAMSLDEHIVEPVTVSSGEMFYVTPMAVEPVSDIAVLGALDDTEFEEDMTTGFDAFCAKTTPVRVCRKFKSILKPVSADLRKIIKRAFRYELKFPVYVHTRSGAWIEGIAQSSMVDGPRLFLSLETPLESGDSGGPIVNTAGELVGLVSWSGETHGACPRPDLTLPVWVLRKIFSE